MNYLIYGSEQEILSEREIKKIIKENSSNVDEFSQIIFNLDETPLENIIDECLTPSLFMPEKIVIIKNAYILQSSSKKGNINHNVDSLIKYLESPSDFTTLIIVVNGNIDEKKDVVTKLKEKAQLIRINNPNTQDWPQVIGSLLAQYKIDINDDARKELVERTSGDLVTVINEIKKLKLYNGKVSLEVIKKLIPAKLEDKLFEMVDSILSNDLGKTYKIYSDLKELNEDPVRLISVLAGQFRFLYQVGYLSTQGMSNDQIAKQFSNVKSGRVYYSLKKIGNHELNDILKIIDELAELDFQIKIGNIDKNRAFELFLIKEH